MKKSLVLKRGPTILGIHNQRILNQVSTVVKGCSGRQLSNQLGEEKPA